MVMRRVNLFFMISLLIMSWSKSLESAGDVVPTILLNVDPMDWPDEAFCATQRSKIGIQSIYELLQSVQEGIDDIKSLLEKSESESIALSPALPSPSNGLFEVLSSLGDLFKKIQLPQDADNDNALKFDFTKLLGQLTPLLTTVFTDKLGAFAESIEAQGKSAQLTKNGRQEYARAPRNRKNEKNLMTVGTDRQSDWIKLAQELTVILQNLVRQENNKRRASTNRVVELSNAVISFVTMIVDGLSECADNSNIRNIIERCKEIHQELLEAITPQQSFDACCKLNDLLDSTLSTIQSKLNPLHKIDFNEMINLNVTLLGIITQVMGNVFGITSQSSDSSDNNSSSDFDDSSSERFSSDFDESWLESSESW